MDTKHLKQPTSGKAISNRSTLKVVEHQFIINFDVFFYILLCLSMQFFHIQSLLIVERLFNNNYDQWQVILKTQWLNSVNSSPDL